MIMTTVSTVKYWKLYLNLSMKQTDYRYNYIVTEVNYSEPGMQDRNETMFWALYANGVKATQRVMGSFLVHRKDLFEESVPKNAAVL